MCARLFMKEIGSAHVDAGGADVDVVDGDVEAVEAARVAFGEGPDVVDDAVGGDDDA